MSTSKKKQAAAKRVRTRRRNAARRRTKNGKTAGGRLSNDGAASPEKVRARMQWLAHEWQLPVSDMPDMTRLGDKQLAYAEKHGIKLSWLISGELKYLKEMIKGRKQRMGVPPTERLRDKLARLSEAQREAIDRMVDNLMADRS